MFDKDLVGPSAPPPHLRVSGIHKRFGGVYALQGVDFEVARGEVMALVGDNGAGRRGPGRRKPAKLGTLGPRLFLLHLLLLRGTWSGTTVEKVTEG